MYFFGFFLEEDSNFLCFGEKADFERTDFNFGEVEEIFFLIGNLSRVGLDDGEGKYDELNNFPGF
jgi:hypothetical protein